MCGLCGILGSGEHWSDGAAGTPDAEDRSRRRRERLERARLVNRVLAHYGLRLDDWQGTSFLLTSRTGRTEMVDNLSALWLAAGKMTSRRLDPLDPALVASLGAPS